MENSLINNFLAPLIVGIILSIVGLIVEYRTRFFAKHIDNLKLHGQGQPSKTSRQGYFATNWAEATRQARVNLAAIYGVRPDEIYITEWDVERFFTSRKLRIGFKIPRDKADEMGLVEWWAVPDEPYLQSEADRDGRILRIWRY